jgi:hypothetical protein
MANDNEYNDYDCEAIERNDKERKIGKTTCWIRLLKVVNVIIVVVVDVV